MSPEERRLRRIKNTVRTYNKRRKRWEYLASDKCRSYKSFKEYRLKTTGNPFNTEAKYRGNREFRLDGDWWYKAPYFYTKDQWKAKMLDKEIENYDHNQLDNNEAED